MKNRLSLVAIAAGLFTLVACEKSTGKKVTAMASVNVKNLPADTTTGFTSTGRPIGANKYTYISLSQAKIIEGDDTLTNKWDIAFKQFFIKVNGGTSATGGGNAGAFIANGNFDNYLEITEPETSFVQDAGATPAISPAPGGWYTYSPSTYLASPIPGKFLVIRTATGHYAKLEITSFYKDGITPDATATPVEKAMKQFFYQLRYVIQMNGTRKFE